jgi:hypothetical protein
MDQGYISDQLKKIPASQYDIEKLSHKIEILIIKVANLLNSETCLYHKERLIEVEGRVTWLEKKIWMGIGGLAVLQIFIAAMLVYLGK